LNRTATLPSSRREGLRLRRFFGKTSDGMAGPSFAKQKNLQRRLNFPLTTTKTSHVWGKPRRVSGADAVFE
jgi:hypothetical protein